MQLRRKSDGVEVELSGDWHPVDAPAPETWEDVTVHCVPIERNDVLLFCQKEGLVTVARGYRLRKVQRGMSGWAFLVERKKEPAP